MKVLWK